MASAESPRASSPKPAFTLVMLCRDLERPPAVRERNSSARLHPRPCTCFTAISPRSPRCGRVRPVSRRDFEPIALLINNAGMVSTRHRISVDGYELTFASNHLGPFLLDRPIARPDGRGRPHHQCRLPRPLPGHHGSGARHTPTARYDPRAAYARSKLANVLHTFALARRTGRQRNHRELPASGHRRHESAAPLAAHRCSG